MIKDDKLVKQVMKNKINKVVNHIFRLTTERLS